MAVSKSPQTRSPTGKPVCYHNFPTKYEHFVFGLFVFNRTGLRALKSLYGEQMHRIDLKTSLTFLFMFGALTAVAPLRPAGWRWFEQPFELLVMSAWRSRCLITACMGMFGAGVIRNGTP